MKTLFTLRFDLHPNDQNRDVLMVFVATPALDAHAFATSIEAEIEANLAPDEVVIVVRGPAFDNTLGALRTDSMHRATLDRLDKSAAVFLIGYDYQGKETQRECIAGADRDSAISLDDFRRRGITSIFKQRRGFVEANATYHFENPSGRHTERFMRLSNILARGAEIAFIGFCCLPQIDRAISVAYLDTPSLYAVIAAINEQRSSFENTERILADNFSSYAGFDEYQFDGGDRALVLISASSSGSLARRLVSEKNVEPDRIIHLLYLGIRPSGSRIVCDLSHDPDVNPDGIVSRPLVEESHSCSMCAGGSHAIKLQGDQFEFAGPQQNALLVGKDHAPKSLAALMGRYVGEKVFELGLGRSTSRSPRQFSINASRLLASQTFQEKLDYALRRSLPAGLAFVISADAHSDPFACEVAARIASAPAIVPRNAIDSIPADTIQAIAIVASVIESGRTLLDISRDLRSIAPKAPLLYLVGMAKTTGEPKRERLESSLIQTHNQFPYDLVTIDEIVLPASADDNAWNSELKLLIDPAVEALAGPTLKPAIAARVERLRRATVPMADDLFLANAGKPLQLQPGFVFWPNGVPNRSGHTQADIYFTVASVLQLLRANAYTTGKPKIISNWFQQTILAPGNFGRFNDDIIQASLLRAAYPYELNYADTPAESREMGRLLRRVIAACQSSRGGAAAEFLLALATKRMQLCHADLSSVLEEDQAGVPIVRFLQDVCRKRLT